MEHADELYFLLLLCMVVFNIWRIGAIETELRQMNDVLLRCARRLGAMHDPAPRRRR